MGLPMLVGVLETFLSCVLDGTAIPCLLRGNPRSWLVYRTGFSSDRWPVSGVGEHSRGCRVCAPLGLLHVLLWVAPCLEVLRIAGRRAVGVLSRTLG
jgi:hypothetical protein